MKCHDMDPEKTYPLGFTFSFPCQQQGLREAVLLRWTKGFNCSDTIGKNVVQMLQEAIDSRVRYRVKAVSLINDTVGTLMSCAYNDPNTAIGLILGTGSNACYFESISKIGTLHDWNNNRKETSDDSPKEVKPFHYLY